MRYYYPHATDRIEALKQFAREHHRRAGHCFRNHPGPGFVLFDTKEDVNQWWKEQTGEYYYKEEYEPGTTFTQQDAYKEIEKTYGSVIDSALASRDMSCDTVVLILGFSYGSTLRLAFINSWEKHELSGKALIHYDYIHIRISSMSNSEVRKAVIEHLYAYFYNSRFKKRIEGSLNYHNKH